MAKIAEIANDVDKEEKISIKTLLKKGYGC